MELLLAGIAGAALATATQTDGTGEFKFMCFVVGVASIGAACVVLFAPH